MKNKYSEKLSLSYVEMLNEVKSHIKVVQQKAILAVNRELLMLYYDIGKIIAVRQENEGWGRQVVEKLSSDLRNEMPDLKGFSQSNMWRMRAFYLSWCKDEQFLAQVVREIPWGHNILLIEKLKTREDRMWYAKKTLMNGWSRSVLSAQIESRLHERQGSAITNFSQTLPEVQSDLAKQTLKDPYIFDFLNISEKVSERELERALLENISQFLLELGVGFAYVGSQYHLEIDGEDYYIDLLFYHIHLRCYFVIDLKMEKFKPEFAGKMNFYLAVVDEQLRKPNEAPSIGLILCKERKKMIVEYALSETNRPVGVAKWSLTRQLPENLKRDLPDVHEIEMAVKARLDRFELEARTSKSGDKNLLSE